MKSRFLFQGSFPDLVGFLNILYAYLGLWRLYAERLFSTEPLLVAGLSANGHRHIFSALVMASEEKWRRQSLWKRVEQLSELTSKETRIWQRSSSFARLLAAAAVDTKWLLEPIGDGDCRHIGEEVPLPSAFELSTDAATVGRVADKADIVIPVGTVSGLHARLEKRDSMLMVTDLDSTNGTFVNNRRVRPGAVTPVPPGSSITFGDEHLAQFKVSMIEKGEENTESIYIEAQFTEAED
ncbi:hypothetical protein SELMODRAFT_446441 [Selaginella moellendorffii]|uniref:FHA domain-containing protein n=1 Tax=Selaginella moellendorffii TaxID=88036 RepID=D8SRE8_SELML|nr:hypothetical protein SELMODRAFT_446441 [Selaginella moellendorffii]